MTTVTEIAPDVYRISTYESQFKLQFNQFLVKDKEPLLFHTGMKGILGKERPVPLSGPIGKSRASERVQGGSGCKYPRQDLK